MLFRTSAMLRMAVVATLAAFARADEFFVNNSTAVAPAHEVEVADITISDPGTGFEDLATIHNGYPFSVHAALIWGDEAFVPNSTNTLLWEMFVDGALINEGSIDLMESRALPDSLDAGSATVTKTGTHNIAVKVVLDDNNESQSDRNYESFNAGASFVPLIMVLIFAVTTQSVELSLGLGIFTAACMVTGTITDGFKTTLDTYILNALADEGHGFVYLFTLFLSGMVGEIQKVGGLAGITVALTRFVDSPMSAQLCTFFAGLIIFFDDYANTLVAGMSMRPLSDISFVSREKLAFIVDATAAPIASIVPISAWVGFEVSLIQAELDKILENDPDPEIETSAFAVFLQTIKYRYYAIFMLFLMPLLILTQRDMGPMLLAERKCRTQKRTDGGDGAEKNVQSQADRNDPVEGTPCRWWNMAVPIVALVAYIFGLLVVSGDDGSGTQSFIEKIENSDSYVALLWGTMAAALTAFAFYILQDKKDDHIVWFNFKGYYHRFQRFLGNMPCLRRRFGDQADQAPEAPEESSFKEMPVGGDDYESEREEPTKDSDLKDAVVESKNPHSQPLTTWYDSLEAFLIGMERIFPALVVLTLAWAMGAAIVAVGLDRFFGDLIVNGGLDASWMPTISFLVSLFVAFATGTSWGTMTIMFPLLLTPTYVASDGDPTIFYATTAGILAGAVAGDHASPISDTTVLSSLASECQLLEHVRTQAPYVLVVTVWSVLVGTIPAGRASFANGVSIFLGFLFMLFHTIFTSARVLNPSGRFDPFTQLYIYFSKDEDLKQLGLETTRAYEDECTELGNPRGMLGFWLPLPRSGGTRQKSKEGRSGGGGIEAHDIVEPTTHMDTTDVSGHVEDHSSGNMSGHVEDHSSGNME